MRELTSAQIAEACGGRIVAGPAGAVATRVWTDSRSARPGDCFVALKGEKFDGHTFAGEAAASGAAVLLVERAPGRPCGAAVIAVDDTLRALQAMAAWYRAHLDMPWVAVGGSNGKTSTKEMAAAALGAAFRVARTRGNLNNHIGVPLTILETGPEHDAAVVEVGTNHPGEIALLAALVRPTVGIVTNIGPEHLEFLVDEAGVAREEGALLDALGEDGVAVLNADCPWTGTLRARARCRVLAAGLGDGADVRVTDIRDAGEGQRFVVRAGADSAEVSLPLCGRHMAQNAALALAAGMAVGLRLDAMAGALGRVALPPGRMRVTMVGGVRVIDDTYNANPGSMRAALQELARHPVRRFAVLGTMGELGAGSERWHRDAGAEARRAGVERLVAVGAFARQYCDGAGDVATPFEEADEAAGFLRAELREGDTVLVKASRSARLERIVEALARGGARAKE